jgi:fructokinase
LILVIGEVLFDIFPEGRRLGGAAFNVAYHLHHLNGPLRFLSRIGQDAEGRAIREFLDRHAFPQDDLQLDPERPSGRVTVSLDTAGTPRFEIVPGVAYDAITATPALEAFVAEDCRLIYFGSLIQRTPQGAAAVEQILKRRSPRVKCLFDVNLRPGCFNAGVIAKSLGATDILKLNDEELSRLAEMEDITGDTGTQVAVLARRYGIEMVALTRAERGSSLFVGEKHFDSTPRQAVSVKDTVGAGDAFAAMLALGYLYNWTPERVLSAASMLAEAVCGIEGAVPVDAGFYDRIREVLKSGEAHR